MRTDYENRERRYPNGERMPDDVNPVGDRGRKRSKGAGHHQGRGNSGPTAAVILIGLGLFFFLSNLGLLRVHDLFRYSPVLLIAVGVFKLAGRRGPLGMVWASALIAVGSGALLLNLGLLHINFSKMWPLILIGAGALALARSLWRPQSGLSGSPAEAAYDPLAEGPFAGEAAPPSGFLQDGFSHDDLPQDDSVVREWAVFGGVKRIIDSKNFQGGEVVSAFGGVELDLRRASIQNNRRVVLDANTAFGGIHIKVPDTWRVAVRGAAVFGGYEDKTLRSKQLDSSSPLLVITGYAVFGGVEIE